MKYKIIRILENVFFIAAVFLFSKVDFRLGIALILYEINIGFAFVRVWKKEKE